MLGGFHYKASHMINFMISELGMSLFIFTYDIGLTMRDQLPPFHKSEFRMMNQTVDQHD